MKLIIFLVCIFVIVILIAEQIKCFLKFWKMKDWETGDKGYWINENGEEVPICLLAFDFDKEEVVVEVSNTGTTYLLSFGSFLENAKKGMGKRRKDDNDLIEERCIIIWSFVGILLGALLPIIVLMIIEK